MDFIELAKERYSVRAFKSTPVEQEKIDRILDAARLAPTARNFQPQKIYIVKSPEMLKKMNDNCRCIYGAPLVFVLGYDRDVVCHGIRWENDVFGETDVAIICTHMMLEATELGLGSCCVGMFSDKEIRECLDIPENILLTLVLPVGYADMGPSERHASYRDDSETVKYL